MILIASALFPPEPVVSANLSFDLASKLAETNKVVVISPYPTRPYGMAFNIESMGAFDFKHVVLDSYTCAKSSILGRFRESYSLGQHIQQYIETNHQKIEVVYANVWPLFAQKALAETCERFKIPFVLHVQDVYPESLTNKLSSIGAVIKKILLPMDRKTLSKADCVITISNQMSKLLSETRNICANKIEIVRNWQNDTEFQVLDEQSTKRESQFSFLYLGSINPTAGVDLLIHAFTKAALKNAILFIAGDGSDKENCQRIASTYAADIRFMNVQPEQVPDTQAKADVLLLPLKKGIAATALPSKMTAYMFSAKPIIASVEANSEAGLIISDNNCGWVSEPEDVDALSKIMKEAYSLSKTKLAYLGGNSLNYARTNLTKDANLKNLVSIVLESRRSI